MTNSVHFPCPECGESNEIPQHYIGKNVRCMKCCAYFTALAQPPSNIHFYCSCCGQSLDSPSELAGRVLKCPACEGVIKVPISSLAPTADLRIRQPQHLPLPSGPQVSELPPPPLPPISREVGAGANPSPKGLRDSLGPARASLFLGLGVFGAPILGAVVLLITQPTWWSGVVNMPSVLLVPICFAIPAIICGHIARSRIRVSGGPSAGSGEAWAGTILGWLGIGLPIVLLANVPAKAPSGNLNDRSAPGETSLTVTPRQIWGTWEWVEYVSAADFRRVGAAEAIPGFDVDMNHRKTVTFHPNGTFELEGWLAVRIMTTGNSDTLEFRGFAAGNWELRGNGTNLVQTVGNSSLTPLGNMQPELANGIASILRAQGQAQGNAYDVRIISILPNQMRIIVNNRNGTTYTLSRVQSKY
jgi:hypothetical protein